ncbi:4-hydroxy-tetrahydrodipicolinate synthase [Sodalis sp. RH14]|uniref:4-hydroxy-tetrahydrodipicolinate synthase n=1 Tax=Sodalis sp. RH14 TaxID=3394329 RepID=UPI0039B3BB91
MDILKSARLITAIKTPYSSNGEIDIHIFDNLVQRQIQYGVDGIVIAGTTGEGHLMDWDEQLSLISHAIEYFGKKIIIIGSTGSNNTREAIHATRECFALGMHASLQINPYYGRTSIDGMQAHFNKVLEYGPTILYNVPIRTGQDIPTELVLSISKHPNFAGIKECAGIERIAYYSSKGIRVWSGNDNDFYIAMNTAKSFGVISVVSNAFPELMRDAVHLKKECAVNKLSALIDWLALAPNPIPINTLLPMLGLCGPVFRLPYVPLNESQRRECLDILSKLDNSIFAKNIDESDFKIL